MENARNKHRGENNSNKQTRIMCLYPKLILNPKYRGTKKNNFCPPVCQDERIKYVPIGCGHCIECRKQKARAWQVRLNEECKNNKGYFLTLTFNEEWLNTLLSLEECNDENKLATYAVRHFLERWRKKYKKSLKHWFITELGEQVGRIHLHGIIFPNVEITQEELQNLWKYGYIYIGEYCNEKSVNYITKYVTKIDNVHKDFEGKILCSAGIGKNYITKEQKKIHGYKEEQTKDYYKLPSGAKVNNPIYYRNKLYTEEEREKLWLQRIEQHHIYILGNEYSTKTDKDIKRYLAALKAAQQINKNLGYGSDETRNAKKYKELITKLNT